MKPLLLILSGLLLGSCGWFDTPSAQVLWSPDESRVPTGALGTIQNFSPEKPLQEFIPSQSRDTLSLETWRLRVDKGQEREEEVKAYQPFIYLFAQATRPSLPLRREPNEQSDRFYNLSLKEEVKVLAKILEEKGDWYQVLTRTGTLGWLKEQNLQFLEKIPGLTPKVVEFSVNDPLLEAFFSQTWRTKTILDQIKNHKVDLNSLQETSYLRGFREEKSIYIRTPEVNGVFTYQNSPLVLQDNIYSFEGTDLKLRFSLDKKTITAYFSKNSQDYIIEFGLLEEELGDLIAAERAYRRELFQSLYAQGPVLRSPGQGDIFLEKDQHFTWKKGPSAGKNALPFYQTIYGEQGVLEFPLSLGDSLRALKDPQGDSVYDGVLTLIFEPQPDSPFHFIYKVVKGGLQLWPTRVLKGEVTVDTIPERTPSYFFSFSRT